MPPKNRPKSTTSATKSILGAEKPEDGDECSSQSETEASDANLEAILCELRQSRRENSENFKALKNDMANLKTCITDVETRMSEVKDRTRLVEEAMAELAKQARGKTG